MILKTSYRKRDEKGSPVEQLVDYLNKSQGLMNRCGCEMDESAKQRFVEATAECDMGRLLTFSPDNQDLSDKELSRATRRTMGEFLEGKYSADYLFAIHRDTDQPHTQVAVAGNEDDLHMDREDIEKLQQSALEEFREEEMELVQLQLDGREMDADVADEHAEALKISTMGDCWEQKGLNQTELDTSRALGVRG